MQGGADDEERFRNRLILELSRSTKAVEECSARLKAVHGLLFLAIVLVPLLIGVVDFVAGLLRGSAG